MYAFYNPASKEYVKVLAQIGTNQNGTDPTLFYEFSSNSSIVYTSHDPDVLQKILLCRDGKATSNSGLGSILLPYNYKNHLDGCKIVELLHKEKVYRITSCISTGYEVEHRDFDGTIEQCMKHLDTDIRDASRNSTLKEIKLSIDGIIQCDTLYDITKFVIEKNLLGE